MAESKYGATDYRHFDRIPIRRALISVSDKTGLIEFAKALAAAGVEIVSTGSTAKSIAQSGIAVTEVSEVTGFAETLDGRVKTLHPSIHAGLLADLRLIPHQQQLRDLGIEPFQLVVVNLYPFVEAINSGAVGEAAIDQIDIGGPAMVRASAKNHANVAIVVDPAKYSEIIAAVEAGGTTLAQRRELALTAFSHTAKYDGAVANWMAEQLDREWKNQAGRSSDEPSKNPGFPSKLDINSELATVLRYGENSHQAAALYKTSGLDAVSGIAQSKQLGGKEMSYNNYVDADAALRAAYDFQEPAVAIIKHANPCGIAIASAGSADPIAEAHAKAHFCDPLSAFGGVIAANRTVTLEMAKQVAEIFTEVIVAPGYDFEALQLLLNKKNLRVLQLPPSYDREKYEIKQISGGLLVQEPDSFANFTDKNWKLVTGVKPDAATRADLEFAWKAVRSVKSNAILLAKDGASVGIGMGQVNRVDSCDLAVTRAGSRVRDTVAASDAFFPFADGLEILIRAGIKAVVQPGGSVRDDEVIAKAQEAGITMYFTGERHFFH
ncbi:MAG: bifunctional phosphoribosylaminoimidazolecarboxamide formyltransferase/IMP cyclohydrolase [Actinomycetota bacterium]